MELKIKLLWTTLESNNSNLLKDNRDADFIVEIFKKKINKKYFDFQEIDGQIESERKYIERLTVEDFGPSKVGKVRKFLWNLTEYPETSLGKPEEV